MMIFAIDRYFELAADADLDAYFEQFADDAIVTDDGNVYNGIAELRGWRRSVPPVSYHMLSSEPPGTASVEVTGDFPGSPVRLSFHFEFDADGRITVLTIAR